MVFILNTGGNIQMKIKDENRLWDMYLIYVEEITEAIELTGHVVKVATFPEWLKANGKYEIVLKEFKGVK